MTDTHQPKTKQRAKTGIVLFAAIAGIILYFAIATEIFEDRKRHVLDAYAACEKIGDDARKTQCFMDVAKPRTSER